MEKEIWENLSLEDLPNEEWRFIPNSDNLYMISNMGRIKSLASIRTFGKTKRKHRERILKQFPNWQGYLSCQISNLNREKIRISSHKCVADVFIPNPNKYPCVNHKNEIKSDNRVENLEHCTYAYNLTYGSRENIRKKRVFQYSLGGEFVAEYDSVKEASINTNTNRRGISNCLNGFAKSANGFIWMRECKCKDKIAPYKDLNKRKIICTSLEGVPLREFESIAEAGRKLKLCTTTISKNCRGLLDKAGKYKFQYK